MIQKMFKGTMTVAYAAGVLGPVLVNYIREYRIEYGVSRADAYYITMYIIALGF